jgi:hypothetical protein
MNKDENDHDHFVFGEQKLTISKALLPGIVTTTVL